MMVANVKPTGQMRQNTGKPNTAAEANVPTSTAWRLSNCTPSRAPPTGASTFAHAAAPAQAEHADGEQAGCASSGSAVLLPTIARVRARSSEESPESAAQALVACSEAAVAASCVSFEHSSTAANTHSRAFWRLAPESVLIWDSRASDAPGVNGFARERPVPGLQQETEASHPAPLNPDASRPASAFAAASRAAPLFAETPCPTPPFATLRFFGRKNLCNHGTGHIQAQNALPTRAINTTTNANSSSGCNMTLLAPAMVSRAPNGQMAEIC